MAETPHRRGPGRPPKPKKVPPISFQLSQGDYEYLTFVSRVMHQLGETENDAARFLVTREVDKMRRQRYHKQGTPSE